MSRLRRSKKFEKSRNENTAILMVGVNTGNKKKKNRGNIAHSSSEFFNQPQLKFCHPKKLGGLGIWEGNIVRSGATKEIFSLGARGKKKRRDVRTRDSPLR